MWPHHQLCMCSQHTHSQLFQVKTWWFTVPFFKIYFLLQFICMWVPAFMYAMYDTLKPKLQIVVNHQKGPGNYGMHAMLPLHLPFVMRSSQFLKTHRIMDRLPVVLNPSNSPCFISVMFSQNTPPSTTKHNNLHYYKSPLLSPFPCPRAKQEKPRFWKSQLDANHKHVYTQWQFGQSS